MARQRGLGRGFDSLIPTELPPAVAEAVGITPSSTESVQQLAVDKIDPNPNQPRHTFAQAELEGLADSIHHHGVMQPLVAVEGQNGRYQLIAGERRLRASKLAGLTEVPVIVRSYDQQQQAELALIENLQRAELNPIETALAYKALMEQFNLSLGDLSSRVGQAKSTVSNVMRLLNLPQDLQTKVIAGDLTEGHARVLLGLDSPAAQEQAAALIAEYGWTTRQIEQYVREAKAGEQQNAVQTADKVKAATSSPLTQSLENRLQTKVMLAPAAKGGKLIIKYSSDEDLERISQLLG